jgi:hypothetical protein
VVSFTPQPFYSQDEIPHYPLDRKLVGHITNLDVVEKRKNPVIALAGN